MIYALGLISGLKMISGQSAEIFVSYHLTEANGLDELGSESNTFIGLASCFGPIPG